MIDKLNMIIALHEIMRNVYFFDTTNLDISIYEASHSQTTQFFYEGKIYTVVQETTCNDSWVKYKIKYYCNRIEFKTDIRFIKKIIKQCSVTKNDCLLDEKIDVEK